MCIGTANTTQHNTGTQEVVNVQLLHDVYWKPQHSHKSRVSHFVGRTYGGADSFWLASTRLFWEVMMTHDLDCWSLCRTSHNLNLVRCWSSVCIHWDIVNLLQSASTLCDADPVCVSTEILSTYINLPQPCVMLIQCMSPLSNSQLTSTCLNPVWCWSSVCPHII